MSTNIELYWIIDLADDWLLVIEDGHIAVSYIWFLCKAL